MAQQITYAAINLFKKSAVIFLGLVAFIYLWSLLAIRSLDFVIIVALLYISIQFSSCLPFWLRKRIDERNKAVFITGSDTGFGHQLAKRLHHKGFRVYAGCLDPDGPGARSLLDETENKIRIVKLDVTDSNDITAAKLSIEESLEGYDLWAVVNNAGISKGTETELSSIEDFQTVFDVNVFGMIRVCKTFLPLLRQCHGRVVNVTSGVGRLPWPLFAVYSLSKQAATGFSDILRMEMNRYDVQVATVEPWVYRTQLSEPRNVEKVIDKSWSLASPELKEAYDRDYLQKVHSTSQRLIRWFSSSNIDEVIDTLEAAVMEEVAQFRYNPGTWYLKLFFVFYSSIPQPIRDFIACKIVFGKK